MGRVSNTRSVPFSSTLYICTQNSLEMPGNTCICTGKREAEKRVLDGKGNSLENTGAGLFSSAALQRSAPQGSLCLPHPRAVLLSSAWTG